MSNRQETEIPLVITVPYVRPCYSDTGELHLDPVIGWDLVVYGLGADQLRKASTVHLSNGRFIRLSKGLPRGSIFIPIRYNKKRRAYMAPAISRIVLTLGGQDLPSDVACDMYIWDIEPELVEALRRKAELEECVEIFREKYNLDEEGVERAREILRRAGITEEPARSLLLKALELKAIREHHIEYAYGLIVIAETLVCFSEDKGLEPIDAPAISMEMASYLFDKTELNIWAYAGNFKNIRGFAGEKARRLLQHIVEQRLPWL